MGDVIELRGGYPFAVTPMPVEYTTNDQHGYPLYEPTPQVGWSLIDGMRWMAAVVELELRAPVVVRRSSMRNACTYSLQIGRRQPITGLPATRVMDVLGGCMTAASLLRGE